MFKKNEKLKQCDLFGFSTLLSPKKYKKLEQSEEMAFFHHVFSRIDETIFEPLYSKKKSRPNAPCNVMIGALLLKERYGWTYKQMLDHIDFDIKTRVALGLNDIASTPFTEPTIFDFQNRIARYKKETGIDLIEVLFDQLTLEQMKRFKVNANIQRSDSFLVSSNIQSYSRIQLLVEVIIRFYRRLSSEDKERYKERFSPYVKDSSSKYLYELEVGRLKDELQELGEIYRWILEQFRDEYGGVPVYKIVERVFKEHFDIDEEKIKVKPNESLSSSSLQSPDDLEATYRKKGGQESRGQMVNITETASPDNQINLITDVVVTANNKDDSEILEERIDKIKEKMPDIDELHTDGGYASVKVDEKMESLEINHIQTAVRGRKAKVEIEITKEESEDDVYKGRCPYQEGKVEKARKRYKITFDLKICKEYPLKSKCQTIEQKRGRVFYFSKEYYLCNRRRRRVDKLPIERRTLRANIEATIKEFRKGLNWKGKLRVRGWFKTMLYAFFTAIMINLRRIYLYLRSTGEDNYNFLFFPLFFASFCGILSFSGSSNLNFKTKPVFSRKTGLNLKFLKKGLF